MFAVLPASTRPAPAHPAVPLAATFLHAALVVFGVVATRQVLAIDLPVAARDPLPLFIAQHQPMIPTPSRATSSRGISAPEATPPRPLTAPVFTPITLPSLAIDPPSATIGTSRSSSGPIPGTHVGVENTEPGSGSYQVGEVDVPAELTRAVTPNYPPTMRALGRSGVVRVRYVVDTLGRVEAGSVVVVESSGESFTGSATEAVATMRFRPARVRGRPVRQLVEQVVRFAMRP